MIQNINPVKILGVNQSIKDQFLRRDGAFAAVPSFIQAWENTPLEPYTEGVTVKVLDGGIYKMFTRTATNPSTNPDPLVSPTEWVLTGGKELPDGLLYVNHPSKVNLRAGGYNYLDLKTYNSDNSKTLEMGISNKDMGIWDGNGGGVTWHSHNSYPANNVLDSNIGSNLWINNWNIWSDNQTSITATLSKWVSESWRFVKNEFNATIRTTSSLFTYATTNLAAKNTVSSKVSPNNDPSGTNAAYSKVETEVEFTESNAIVKNKVLLESANNSTDKTTFEVRPNGLYLNGSPMDSKADWNSLENRPDVLLKNEPSIVTLKQEGKTYLRAGENLNGYSAGNRRIELTVNDTDDYWSEPSGVVSNLGKTASGEMNIYSAAWANSWDTNVESWFQATPQSTMAYITSNHYEDNQHHGSEISFETYKGKAKTILYAGRGTGNESSRVEVTILSSPEGFVVDSRASMSGGNNKLEVSQEGLTYNGAPLAASSNWSAITNKPTINNTAPDVNGNYTIVSTYIATTHADLLVRRQNGTLVAGVYYMITDYQTIHIIPNSTHLNVNGVVYTDKTQWTNSLSEGVERLIVLAVSTTKTSPIAYSEQFPNDIIHYDITKTVCEDLVTPRKGLITFRKDTTLHIDCAYDWRKVLFIRYGFDHATMAYSTTKTYAKNNVADYNGKLYVCLKSSTLNVEPSNLKENDRWALLYDYSDTSTSYLRTHVATKTSGFQIAAKTVTVDANDYRYYNTFSLSLNATDDTAVAYLDPNKVYNISIARNYTSGDTPKFNNIVFCARTGTSQISNITLGYACQDMTFGNGASGLRIGEMSENIIVRPSVSSCDFGIYFRSTVFTGGYLFECTSDSWFFSNVFSAGVQCTKFGNEMRRNNFKGAVQYSLLMKPYIDDNTFHSDVNYCVFNQYIRLSWVNQPLNWVILNQRVLSVTLQNAYSDVVVSHRSSTGKLYYDTIDNEGVMTLNELV